MYTYPQSLQSGKCRGDQYKHPDSKTQTSRTSNEEHIVLGDFNLHHEAWGAPGASKALIEKSEELLIVTQRWEMEQMVPVGTATCKESTGESNIDMIFATLLLTESLIACDIAGDFDHDSDHQPILSKWTMRTIDNPLSSRLLLSKMDIPALKKTLTEELAKDPPCTSTTPDELDIKVHSLISAIDTAMTLAIPKARLSPKSVPGFDEECKEIQMKARRLKKIWKKEETDESWEDFRLARAEKGRVIAKAKRKAYRKSREEACASPESMWKAIKHVQNRTSRQPCLPNIQRSDGSYITEPKEKIEELKKVLLPAPHSADVSDLANFEYPNDLPLTRITQKEILQTGKYLRMNKALGPDQIPNKVLKVIMPEISGHLEQIFNDSLSIGYYPAHFKESIIIILRKQGGTRDFCCGKSVFAYSLA